MKYDIDALKSVLNYDELASFNGHWLFSFNREDGVQGDLQFNENESDAFVQIRGNGKRKHHIQVFNLEEIQTSERDPVVQLKADDMILKIYLVRENVIEIENKYL